VPLGIDGVAGKASATIAGVVSESGALVVYALMSGEPVTIAPLSQRAIRSPPSAKPLPTFSGAVK